MWWGFVGTGIFGGDKVDETWANDLQQALGITYHLKHS